MSDQELTEAIDHAIVVEDRLALARGALRRIIREAGDERDWYVVIAREGLAASEPPRD